MLVWKLSCQDSIIVKVLVIPNRLWIYHIYWYMAICHDVDLLEEDKIILVHFSLLLPIKLLFFQLCDKKLLLFISLLNFFCIGFEHWFIASFLYCSPVIYRFFLIFKAIVKTKRKIFAIVFKSNGYRIWNEKKEVKKWYQN